LKNWRRYQDLIGSVPDAPESEVASVIAGGARLQDLVRFWRKQGVTRFRVVPAEPSRYMGVRRLEEWESRRKQYLEDLKVLAFSETTRLRGRDLQKEFEGPTAILSSWSRLSRAEPYRVCGAGYTYIAVDSDGALFPCQGFVGFAARSIGDVRSSVLPAKLAEFRSARLRVQSACNGCWARFLCEGGCCAGDPEAGVVLNTWKGCEFTKAHVEIAVQSYYNWCGHGVESGDEKGKTRTSA
jgi:radical SAM protein with 4Fe4S-binding SPASM domain